MIIRRLIYLLFIFVCASLFTTGVASAMPILSWPSADATLAIEHVDGNSLFNTIFRIVYASPEQRSYALHQVWIDLNDDGIVDSANELFSPTFSPANPFGNFNWAGELLTAYDTIAVTSNRTVHFKFIWTDTAGVPAAGAPTGNGNFVTIPTYNYEPFITPVYPGPYPGVFVNPKVVENNGTFIFKINYTDWGNEAPLTASIYIDLNADNQYQPTECFSLIPELASDTTYDDGKDYTYSVYLTCTQSETLKYYFKFQDSAFTVTTNEDSIKLLFNFVPYLDFLASANNYTSSIVYPLAGKSGDVFTFRVNYISASNQQPTDHKLKIDSNANGTFNIGEYVDLNLIRSDSATKDGVACFVCEYSASVPLFNDGMNNGIPIMFEPYFTRAGSGIITGNASVSGSIALTYVQEQPLVVDNNFPNPFGRGSDKVTCFAYSLSEDRDVFITIYNLAGQKVKEFLLPAGSPGAKQAYNYSQTWDGRDESGNFVLNGVYFYMIKSGKNKEVKKLVFIK